MPTFKRTKQMLPLLWLGAAACLLYVASIDSPIVFAAWLSPVFLLRFTRSKRTLTGFLMSLAATTVAGYFATRSMIPLPDPILLLVLIIGGALSLLPYLVDRLVYRKLPLIWGSMLLPVGMVCSEFLQTRFKEGLSWGGSAYSQYGMPALLQVVSVTGVWGLVFLIHWLAPVANVIWQDGFAPRASARLAMLFAGVMAMVLICGEARLILAPIANTVRVAGVVPPPSLDWLTVEELQPPLLEPETIRASVARYRPASLKIQDRLFEVTEREAHAGARIVVWSEMAAWVFVADEEALLGRARETSQRLGIHLLIAIASLRPSEEKLVDNKVVLVTPDGSVAWAYRKSHPVPGSEEALTVRGDGNPKTAQTPAGRVGAVICFDMDYPASIRHIARAGIDVLFAPSHDTQSVREIHARMAVLRAIENGVALVRPVANGIGVATDAYGRTLASVGYMRSGGASLVAQMPVHGVRTVYSMWGDWFAWLCLSYLFALLVAAFIPRFKLKMSRLMRPRSFQAFRRDTHE
jgi:apolipoprotein N-acyltransferase